MTSSDQSNSDMYRTLQNRLGVFQEFEDVSAVVLNTEIASEAPLSETKSFAGKGRILVVDDIEENLDHLKRELIDRGYDVSVANSGQSALTAVARNNFDLVLLHIMMPGMTEMETLVELRRNGDQESLPVILVSAKKESEEIEQALEKGASDFITRPIDYPMAFARIETHLALKRAVDAQKGRPPMSAFGY